MGVGKCLKRSRNGSDGLERRDRGVERLGDGLTVDASAPLGLAPHRRAERVESQARCEDLVDQVVREHIERPTPGLVVRTSTRGVGTAHRAGGRTKLISRVPRTSHVGSVARIVSEGV